MEIKDSGQRLNFESGMIRDTEDDKPRFDLCLPLDVPYDEQLLTRFAKHMAGGAKKYAERNWELSSTQEELDRYLSSAFRHFMQWYTGETDEDHASAVLFNITAAERLRYKLALAKKTNDRIYPVSAELIDRAEMAAWREWWIEQWKKIKDQKLPSSEDFDYYDE